MFRYYAIVASSLLLGASMWMQATAATADIPSVTIQQQAAAGNAEAEAKLGLELIKSKDPADTAKAVEWFRKSAAQGNADGEWNLGAAYFAGVGVTRDVPTAMQWMRKSLSDGSSEHMLEYAVMLRSFGMGSQQEVTRWIRKSAEAGLPQGMMFLAMVEQKKNPADAQQWLLKAAQTGYVTAQIVLGEAYIRGGAVFGPPNMDAGMHWLREAAAQGNAHAEGLLAVFLISGDQHVPANPAEGVQWATKAAAKHNAFGYYALGLAYQHGGGERVDPAKAWYNFAAAQRLDIRHELTKVSDAMSIAATKLMPTQIEQLRAEVAKIPVPNKKDGRVTLTVNGK